MLIQKTTVNQDLILEKYIDPRQNPGVVDKVVFCQRSVCLVFRGHRLQGGARAPYWFIVELSQ